MINHTHNFLLAFCFCVVFGSCEKPEVKHNEPDQCVTYANMVYFAAEQVIDLLDVPFYLDEYIKSDEQRKSDIQKMYFDGCEIEYNESTGEAILNLKGVLFNIQTNSNSILNSGAEWEVIVSNGSQFSLTCSDVGHHITGDIRTEGFSYRDDFRSEIDLNLELGTKDKIRYHDTERMDQILYRPVLTYKIDGTIITSVVGNEEIVSISSTLTRLNSYDPKEYIDNEPIWTGTDAYFTTGRISSTISLSNGSELLLYSVIRTRSTWEISLDGGDIVRFCPSQPRF